MPDCIIPESYQQVALNATYQIETLLGALSTAARDMAERERDPSEVSALVDAMGYRLNQLNGFLMGVLGGCAAAKEASLVEPFIARGHKIEQDMKDIMLSSTCPAHR